MGRPKKEEPKGRITINLEQKDIKDIERIAKKLRISKAQFSRNICLMGLDDARGMERLGIIGAIGLTRKSIDSVKKRFSKEALAIFNGEEEQEIEA